MPESLLDGENALFVCNAVVVSRIIEELRLKKETSTTSILLDYHLGAREKDIPIFIQPSIHKKLWEMRESEKLNANEYMLLISVLETRETGMANTLLNELVAFVEILKLEYPKMDIIYVTEGTIDEKAREQVEKVVTTIMSVEEVTRYILDIKNAKEIFSKM